MDKTRKRLLLAGAIVVAVVGFLLFRPDTLFTNVRTSESREEAFASTTTRVAGAAPVTSATETTESTTTSAAVQEIAAVSSGSFTGIDHRASGSVNVYQQDGRFVLRFEDDTDIQNGPDLYVWVLATDSYRGGIPTEYIDLGRLTGNIGSQNYQLPDDFNPEVYRTVLVWCLRFAVPFAAAPLT